MNKPRILEAESYTGEKILKGKVKDQKILRAAETIILKALKIFPLSRFDQRQFIKTYVENSLYNDILARGYNKLSAQTVFENEKATYQAAVDIIVNNLYVNLNDDIFSKIRERVAQLYNENFKLICPGSAGYGFARFRVNLETNKLQFTRYHANGISQKEDGLIMIAVAKSLMEQFPEQVDIEHTLNCIKGWENLQKLP